MTANAMTWTNQENLDFYAEMPEETFADLLDRSGLGQCEDLQFLYPEIEDSRSILEIGSGFGRVLAFLIKAGYAGHIYSFERTPCYVQLLRQKYAPRVAVIAQDILEPAQVKGFDTILWLWAGLGEFSPMEQVSALTAARKLLAPGGALYLDLPHLDSVHTQDRDGRTVRVTMDDKVINVYLPTPGEMSRYCNAAGFTSCLVRTYAAGGGKSRYLYRFE